jgi:hypothetical protein
MILNNVRFMVQKQRKGAKNYETTLEHECLTCVSITSQDWAKKREKNILALRLILIKRILKVRFLNFLALQYYINFIQIIKNRSYYCCRPVFEFSMEIIIFFSQSLITKTCLQAFVNFIINILLYDKINGQLVPHNLQNWFLPYYF